MLVFDLDIMIVFTTDVCTGVSTLIALQLTLKQTFLCVYTRLSALTTLNALERAISR